MFIGSCSLLLTKMKRRTGRRAGASRVTVAEVRKLIERIDQVIASGNHGHERIRRELRKIDQQRLFSEAARPLFQDLLARFGISTAEIDRLAV